MVTNNPIYSSKATIFLIILYLAVYLANSLALNITSLFNFNIFAIFNGQWWRLFTYPFFDPLFVFSLLGLLFFGSILERLLGPAQLLLIFFSIAAINGLAAIALYAIGFIAPIFALSLFHAYYIMLAAVIFAPQFTISLMGITQVNIRLIVIFFCIYLIITMRLFLAPLLLAYLALSSLIIMLLLGLLYRFNPFKRLISRN
ncbi:MAG: hypothetical protein FWE37_02285 [Spirochaetaceae bacterium]|nr:hypothetical protein [Spirochaetaceae bacterium]